jgi:hypothetical protein
VLGIGCAGARWLQVFPTISITATNAFRDDPTISLMRSKPN